MFLDFPRLKFYFGVDGISFRTGQKPSSLYQRRLDSSLVGYFLSGDHRFAQTLVVSDRNYTADVRSVFMEIQKTWLLCFFLPDIIDELLRFCWQSRV